MSRRPIEDVLEEHTGDRRPKARKARKAAEEIRNRADRFGKAAVSDQLLADATRMEEYASGLELDDVAKDLGVGESNTPTEGDVDEASDAAPAKRRTAPRGRVGRAIDRELVDRPGDAIASGVGLFWRVVVWTLVLVLLYVLLKSSAKTVRLLDSAAYWVTRIVYPRGAFGNYADQLHGRSNGKPLQGPPAPTNPRRTP